MRAVLRRFREQHPEVRLTTTSGIVIPEASVMDTGPLMAIAGGVSPDVIYVNFRQSDSYIQQNFLYPLDQWIEELPPGEIETRVLSKVKPVVYRRGPDGEKHWWALPYGNYVKALVWRKDLFQAKGLNPNRPPKDWDELYRFAQICTDPEEGTYGLVWGRGLHWSWNFYSLLVSAGASAMVERGEDEWYASFNTPEAVTAYDMVLRMVQREWISPEGETIEGVVYRGTDPTLWVTGRIGMREMYITDELLADINPDLMGIAPVPMGPSGRHAAEINCTMCGVFSGVAEKGPEVLQAAWDYVHFIGSEEAKLIRAKVMVENGYGLFVNPVYLEKLGYHDYVRRIPTEWKEAYRVALRDGVPEPYGRNTQTIYDYMTYPADDLLVRGIGKGHLRDEVRREKIQAVLDTWVERANEKLIGRIPPGEMRKRRIVAGVVAVLIVILFAWLFRYIARVFRPPAEVAKGGWMFRRYSRAYLILIPALGSIFIWMYVPLVRGAIMAFQDYRITMPSTWVGLDNFAQVLWDGEFWHSMVRSLYYALLAIAMGFFAPIGLAVLLHEVPRGKVLFRTIYYLPAVISGLVVMLMWKNFYESSEKGFLNQLLMGTPPWLVYGAGLLLAGLCLIAARAQYRNQRKGTTAVFSGLGLLFGIGVLLLWRYHVLPIGPQEWLNVRKWAMPCVVLPTAWAGMGPGCLIYLAALKTVPEELYEAADMDGANFFEKLWNVTLPTIKILIIINFIGAVVNAFRVAGYILAMTGGGPANATKVMALKIFYDAFVYLQFGLATANAWILGAMLIGFTVFQLKRLANVEFRTARA
jgi:ABC-type sugar transport system permease subunit/ABC-type glycerol-3-phosphate transport system substrate-binding protein